MAKSDVEIESVRICYVRDGKSTEAVRDVTFKVSDREFVALLGPSGCGKTTLLHAVGGLVPISEGNIRCVGRKITGPGPERVIVFQEQSLLKWRTVRSNIEFALECKRVPKAERLATVNRLVEQIGLHHRANAYPYELSGGMKQRVAIARALAYDADVLLMDEPFGALDAQTKLTMQSLLLDIWQNSRKTVLFVTHDIDEAIYLADRIVVMTRGPGRINAEISVDAARPRSREFLLSDLFLNTKRRVFNTFNDSEDGQDYGTLS